MITPGMIGPAGEMPREEPLVAADRLARDDALARLELEHLVEEEKRVAVRDDLLDHLAAERRRGCQPPTSRSRKRLRPRCA